METITVLMILILSINKMNANSDPHPSHDLPLHDLPTSKDVDLLPNLHLPWKKASTVPSQACCGVLKFSQ